MKPKNPGAVSWWLVFSIIFILIGAWGCSSAPASGGPSIEITSPENGATVSAGALHVDVLVSNFTLVDKLGQANVPGEGHIHYFLDVAAPDTPGKPAIPPAGSIWAATPSTTYSFENVPVGKHTLSAELVNNDHTPLSPPVISTVTFTAVAGGAP
jgi:hypothetical protein